MCFFVVFSSRRRHTRCALVTGVQTCALPIPSRSRRRGEDWPVSSAPQACACRRSAVETRAAARERERASLGGEGERVRAVHPARGGVDGNGVGWGTGESVRVDMGVRRIITKKITQELV